MSALMDEKTDNLQFNNLLDKVKLNEAIFHKYQRIELHLLGARNLRALMHLILHDLKINLDLDWVSLSLFDPEEVIQNILVHEKVTLNETRNLNLLKQHCLISYSFNQHLQPNFGDDCTQNNNILAKQGSMIELPLIRQNFLIGSMILASKNPMRFNKDDGTLFLERLAHIVAICIENAVNMSQTRLLSLRDGLTGAYNRRYFEERLQEEIAWANRQFSQLSCVFMDIDFFKQINDQYGHLMGDQVLVQTAEIIKSSLRQTDILARYGGEEFIILLPDTTKQQALNITHRIRENYALKVFEHDAQSFCVTLSAGIANYAAIKAEPPKPIKEVCTSLIAKADKALYQAKENGRNQVILAD